MKLYDILDATVNEISQMQRRINEDFKRKKQAEVQVIIDRLRGQYRDQPLYVLILDPEPNGDNVVRCISPGYQEVVEYLQKEETCRYDSTEDQLAVGEWLQILRQQEPPQLGTSIQLPRIGALREYEIRCVDFEYFLQRLRLKQQWLQEKLTPQRMSFCEGYDDD